jgi:hypothetical protein
MLTALIVLVTAFLLLATLRTRASASDADWKSSYRYAHAAAKKYRAQRDNLQHRLTQRVLQVRELETRLTGRRLQAVHRPDSLEAIRLASIAYGVSYGLLKRRAHCETGGTFNRYAKNRSSSASGLFQFLYPSTWSRTPYADESVWSPYANALAAAWMERQGRGGEWACQ